MFISTARRWWRRQVSQAMEEARLSSMTVFGARSLMKSDLNFSKMGRSSSESGVIWPVKPSRMAFRRVLAFVSGLCGPVEFCALRRFASICFCVDMVVLLCLGNSMGGQEMGGGKVAIFDLTVLDSMR